MIKSTELPDDIKPGDRVIADSNGNPQTGYIYHVNKFPGVGSMYFFLPDNHELEPFHTMRRALQPTGECQVGFDESRVPKGIAGQDEFQLIIARYKLGEL